MNPILHFIDWLVRQHGDLICALFVYVGLPLTAWFLDGVQAGRNANQAIRLFWSSVRPAKPSRQ